MKRFKILMWLVAMVGFSVMVSRADMTKRWNFTTKSDYELSDASKIEVDITPPGYGQLLLQPQELYRSTITNYQAGVTLQGLRIGDSASLRLDGTPGNYSSPGSFVSRVFDKGVAGGWQLLNTVVDNGIFTLRSLVGEVDPTQSGLFSLLHLNNSWRDEISGLNATPYGSAGFTTDAVLGSHAANLFRWSAAIPSYPAQINGLTMACWVKLRARDNWAGILFSQGENAIGLEQDDTTGVGFGINGTRVYVRPVPLNEYHLLVGTWDGVSGEMAIYLDGSRQGVRATAIKGAKAVTQPFVVSAKTTANGSASATRVDEVAMWNRAMTEDEVRDIYLALSVVRVKVRSGSTPALSGSFVGPDGTDDSYYVPGVRTLRSGGTFNVFDRYVQYKLDVFSNTDGTDSPRVNRIVMSTVDGVDVGDETFQDFARGEPDANMVINPPESGYSFIGLAKKANGGYQDTGTFTSPVLDSQNADTFWQNLFWSVASGLDASAPGVIGIWRMNGDWAPAAGSVFGIGANDAFSPLAKLGSACAVFNDLSTRVNFGLNTDVSTLMFWMNDARASDGLLELSGGAGTLRLSIADRILRVDGVHPSVAKIYLNGSDAGMARLLPGWNHVALRFSPAFTTTNLVLGVAGGDYMGGMADEMAVLTSAFTLSDLKSYVSQSKRFVAGRVRAQVRSGATVPLTGAFTGPGGDPASYFGNGASLNVPGKRYLQYRLFLEGDGRSTPIAGRVTVLSSAGSFVVGTSADFSAGNNGGQSSAWYGEPMGRSSLLEQGPLNLEASGDATAEGVWHLDEETWAQGGAVVLDAKGARPGTPSGGARPLAEGSKVGLRCGDFDGESGFISLPAITLSGSFAVSFWMQSVTNARSPLISTRSGGGFYEIELNGDGQSVATGRVAFTVGDGVSTRTAVSRRSNLNDGQWHHIAALRTANQVVLFVDGDREATANTGTLGGAGNGVAYLAKYGDRNVFFGGRIDEVAIWSRALTLGEVGDLAAAGGRSKGSSEYVSDVLNAGGPSIWQTLFWVANSPYTNPISVNDDTLVAFWRMEEAAGSATVLDQVSSRPGTLSGSPVLGVEGRHGRAIQLPSGGRVTVAHSVDLEPAFLSVEAWVNLTTPGAAVVVGKGSGNGYVLGLAADGTPYWQVGTTRITGRMPLMTGQWIHLLGSYNGQMLGLYVNGTLDVFQDMVGASPVSGQPLYIGGGLVGRVDEVAIHERALNEEEIFDHYRSGAGKIRFQARASNDATFTGINFVGPSNNPSAYFTEFTGSDMVGIFSLSQYFQFRAYFETEDARVRPQLYGVRVYFSKYPIDTPYVQPTTAQGLVFPGKLIRFSHNRTFSANTDIKYQISGDAGDAGRWFYWDASSGRWTPQDPLDGDVFLFQSSSRDDINNNIGKFYLEQYDKTGGVFRFRAFLKSDGAEQVKLDWVEVAASSGRITLTAPNGLSSDNNPMVVGVPYDITWTSTGVVSQSIGIELWDRNADGVLFKKSTLATGIPNSGLYNTVISDDQGTNYVIRIRDELDATIEDWSDGPFWLIGGMRLTRPNGGERWYVGDTNLVTWQSPSFPDLGSPAMLWISYDGATNWVEITSSSQRPTNAVGLNSYRWLTASNRADFISETARMGVTPLGAADPLPHPPATFYGDTSDQTFTLAGLAVLFPTATNAVRMNSDVAIRWVGAGVGSAGVKVEFFDGTKWTTLAEAAPHVGRVTEYMTQLTAAAPTEAARIRLTSNADPKVWAISDPFILADINIVTPVGGGAGTRDKWQIGTTNYVRWTAGGAGGRVDIEYTADGSNWLPIAMGYTNRNSGAGQVITNVSPRWVITGPPSAIAQVRVRSVSIPTLSMTTLPFSISGVQLVSPNGGEIWEFVQQNVVNWLFEEAGGTVALDISFNGGLNYESLVDLVGIYGGSVTLPAGSLRRPANSARIRIRATAAPSPLPMSDGSDTNFTIRGIAMIAPTNGSVYTMGTVVTDGLRWYSAATEDTTAQLFYSPDGVNYDSVIRFGPNDFTGNVDGGDGFNKQNWDVSRSLVPSTSGRVKVLTQSASGTFTSLTEPFVLRGIRLTAPARGAVLDVGASATVTWAAAGLAPAAVATPMLSVTGTNGPFITAGMPASVNVSDQSLEWPIDPDVDPSTNAVIRLSVTAPAKDTDIVMYSDPFVLRGIKVVSPGTGTNWVLGRTVTVAFRSAGMGAGAPVNIYYSPDGVNYDLAHPVATEVPTYDGLNTFEWTIENDSVLTRMPSPTGTVKVVAAGGEGVSRPFRLRGIKVTRPTSANVWSVGDVSEAIRWVSVDAPSTFNIGFTVWSGSTSLVSEVIATGVAGSTYNWVMTPNAIGREVTIQVQSGSYTGVSERFEIVSASSIRLLSPVAGDYWRTGETNLIRWIRGGTMANAFVIKYSTEPYTVTNILASGAFPLENSIFSYTWAPIPSTLGRTRIIITNQTATAIRTQLDDFTIAPRFSINPFPGSLYAQEPISVDWTTYGHVTQGVDLYYSVDPQRSPSSWVLVTKDGPLLNVANGQPSTYLWTVPNPVGQPVRAWLRIQDHAYANERFSIAKPGPYDDLGMFDINFYTITWHILDRVTGEQMDQLSVTDSSGWSEAGLQSPVVHQYPYGRFDTVFFRKFFNNLVVFNWNSKPSRTITQYMDRSEIDPDYQVLSDFQYDAGSAKFMIHSWIERGGEILADPDSCLITIFDKRGAVVATLSDESQGLIRLDPNGVFWHEWFVSSQLSREEIYFAKVEIKFAGATYSAGVTYTLHLPADQQIVEEILQGVLRTESNIIENIGGEIAGLRTDTTEGFSNLTSIVSETQEDMQGVVSNVNAMAATFEQSIDILTNQVSVIGPAVSNMVQAVSNVAEDVTSSLATILTRPPSVLYGSTNTFLYKTRPGYDAGLVTFSAPSAGYSAAMTEVVNGIYEAVVVVNWGTNSYTVVCRDPSAQDSMVLNVVGADQQATAEMMQDMEKQLTQIEGDVQEMAQMVSDLENTDLTDVLTQLDALTAQVEQVQTAVGPLEGLDGTALARIEEKLGELESQDPETFFGRLNDLANQLSRIESISQDALQKAGSARTAAGNASSAAMGIQTLIEKGELLEASQMLKDMRRRLMLAQQGVEEIPGMLGTGKMYATVSQMAERINEFAGSKGYKNLLKLETPFLGAGEGAGGTGVSKDALDALIRDMQEMRSTMQFMQKLMDEMRYEPVVEETLFGVE